MNRAEFIEIFKKIKTNDNSVEKIADMDAMKSFDMNDMNGDGKIQFDEFMAIFKEKQVQNDMNLIE